MDHQDSSSWSSRFLSVFGKKKHVEVKPNSSASQQSVHASEPSASTKLQAAASANTPDVRQEVNINQNVESKEQYKPIVPPRFKITNARVQKSHAEEAVQRKEFIDIGSSIHLESTRSRKSSQIASQRNEQTQASMSQQQQFRNAGSEAVNNGSIDVENSGQPNGNRNRHEVNIKQMPTAPPRINIRNASVQNSGRSATPGDFRNNYPEAAAGSSSQIESIRSWQSAHNASQRNERTEQNMSQQQQFRNVDSEAGNNRSIDVENNGNRNQRSGGQRGRNNDNRRSTTTSDSRNNYPQEAVQRKRVMDVNAGSSRQGEVTSWRNSNNEPQSVGTIHRAGSNNSINVENNGQLNGNRKQSSGRNKGGHNNDRRPNVNHGNQNQRRATASQASQQRGSDNNSGQGEANGSRRNSCNASHKGGATNSNMNHLQQNRNAGSDRTLSNDQNRGQGQNVENGNFHRRKDNHRTFFGFKKLENYLKVEADSVVISLHSEIEAFESFLKENRAYEGNMFETLLAVLSEKVFSDESNLVAYQNNIVKLLASTEIMNRFRDKCMTLDESKFKFMYNIADFMKRRMPVSAGDSLSGLVTFCIARLGMLIDKPEYQALHKQFQDLFKSLHEKRQHEEVEAKARKPLIRGKFTDNDLKSFDKLKPPDDFRDIPIIPTVPELLSTESSFLRPNKQSGSYADAEHYLDVQFRLLREDFMQPLKQGIQEYLTMRKQTSNPRMPKGSPIRLYYNVKCLTAEVKNESLHYWIQLHSDCSKIQWEKSRRLLPGNLVLLAKNSASLDSVVFATVGFRNDDDLKKHRKLTIIPEITQSCSVDVLCDDTDLLLIESEVYWESFRHVLKTAQVLNLDTFPLARYIVRAFTDVQPPPSLLEPDDEIAPDMRLPFAGRHYAINPLARHWPRAEMLGLDENQFEAFKAALTKQFVIIQGPPGTGKTYVGLRIAEVILQNPRLRTGRKEHPDEPGTYSEYKGPLLCICYTNHALDQFLEGILNIMNAHQMDPKIVRVGGRSKSEVLREFNLRDVARRTNRRIDGLQWRELKDTEMKMKANQDQIKGLKSIIAELDRPTGIVKFDNLNHEIYQTLCFEFSSQLMDKLSSASFFKLTNSDLYNIKENIVTDVVKKWFEYVKVNSNKKAKAPKAEDIRQEVPPADEATAEEEEEFYDMDELMEHRIEDDFNHGEAKIRFECSNSVGRFHVDNMSTLLSSFLMKEYETSIQANAINSDDKMSTVYAKQRNVAQIRETESVEQKRLAILQEIFRCLNDQCVKIPDVTEKLESLRRFNVMDSKNVVDGTLPSIAERYAAYFVVAKRAKQLMNEIIRGVEREMIEKAETIAQLKRKHDVDVLKGADVVGMTTTGAAKFNDLLVKMKSRIVIVEEAAEVLEAHIVTSLTKYTDHLILIGDHKQLKPSTAVYDLSRKYDLDVSLFERMINNNMTCYSLLAQHRMRSEIADLIRGSIYQNLTDAPNVHEYESITGMTKDLFFLSHNKFEKSEGDTLSKLNEFEADYLAGLAGYLLKQGYKASAITVLTTYTGQMFLLKSKFRKSESLKPIHITCVDNFQGEENDIILLSLVRSNAEGKMGFLSVSNRVCVALSRSKKGLYIVGNMNMLSKQTIWSEIKTKLEKRKQTGTIMKVVCQSHKTQSDIATGDDFIKKCPEGGCSEMCGLLMACSHYCPRFCHAEDLKHENYRCRELCRKPCLSELAHPCRLQCHLGKICSPCTAQVHKPRSCGHDIIVDCHRSADEEFCRTKVKRQLKCDHEVTVDCSHQMDGWLCRTIVDKVLRCGHESKQMCHVNADQYQCKMEVKKKLPCTHYRNMKCFEEPTSSMCKTFVEKELPCGHAQTIECRFDPKEVTCSVKVTVTLNCEHTIVVPCFQKRKGKINCVELCEERLSCGHSCPLKCHYFKDRHHDKFRCKKPCAKSCAEGHPCRTNHDCSTQCKKCGTVVERELPECGHIGKMFCFESLTEFKCTEKCTKMLLCGHRCGKKCSEPCGTCKEMTTKRTPVCGHNQSVPCDESPLSENCKHAITIGNARCGHKITVACNMRSVSLDEIQVHCTEPCGFMFPGEQGCGHKCSGTCGSCLMGSLHQKCKDKCLRPLICGHLCNFPCSKNCPPCKEKCQMKCEHSKCKKMCGDACFSCKERCSWKCKHKRCTKLCGQMCDRGPCHEPCDKRLRCGHMCVGFCGEICPPLCRICNLDQLTEFQLLFSEDEEDARFIWLPDCKHTIEVEGLTMHFNATDDSRQIGLKKCPRCTTLVTTLSGRFGNIVRKSFLDVAEVKKRFYGNRAQNQRLTEEIQHNLQVEENKLLNHLPSVKSFFEKILYFDDLVDDSPGTRKLRQVDINTLNSLQQIWVWAKEILKNLSEYSNNAIRKDCDAIFGNITSRQLPLCAFEVDNIGSEIQRLIDKIQFNRRWDSASTASRQRKEAKELYEQILIALTSRGIYDAKSKQKVIDCTKNLEKVLKTGLGISEAERLEIVKALNMKQGHWFKCPNGHPYMIGECGGAMETAVCNECGAAIGGGSHALLASNQFAPEMDGAARPAWDSVMVPQNFGF